MIGAPYRDGDGGAVYVVYGPGIGSNSVAQANISLLPHENHTLLGSNVWVVDLDQDGALDVAASAPNADTQLPRTGAVLGIHGPLGAAENFDWVLYSSDTGDHLADSLLPTDSGFVLGPHACHRQWGINVGRVVALIPAGAQFWKSHAKKTGQSVHQSEEGWHYQPGSFGLRQTKPNHFSRWPVWSGKIATTLVMRSAFSSMGCGRLFTGSPRAER